MAKDKEFEKKYKEIRLRREYARKERRQARNKLRLMNKKDGVCPYCGGQMYYCRICDMWSSSCCKEYGTCMCS